MKLAVIGFTRSGCRYAKQIEEAMNSCGNSCAAYGKCSCAGDCGVEVLEESLREWTEEQFASQDALIFIGAAGIAVRAIAPFVRSKDTDPAVVCMDEQAQYAVSLLSGHLGGANELTKDVARICGALPVITTATDVGGRFSVDSFAKRERLHLDSLALAKEVAARVLENQTVGLYCDFEISGQVPLELSMQKKDGLGISISLDDRYDPFPKTLHLVPRITVLGIGCRKGTKKEQIERLVNKAMAQNQISLSSIGKIASIDLKREERGLLKFCADRGVELQTYAAEELEAVECENGFSESEFVKSVTGLGNVCERAALRASGRTRLLQHKLAEDGVTVAIALEEYRVRF